MVKASKKDKEMSIINKPAIYKIKFKNIVKNMLKNKK